VLKFTTTNNFKSAHHTCYKGEANTSYATLVATFGEPINYLTGEHGSDGKTQVEWIVEFADGTVATIYDWKFYDTPFEEVPVWNIGGFDKRSVELVHSALAEVRND